MEKGYEILPNILMKMLKRNPDNRISFEELVDILKPQCISFNQITFEWIKIQKRE